MSKHSRKVSAEQVAGEVREDAVEVRLAKKEKRRTQLTPPPAPPVELDGVANPLVVEVAGKKTNLKRALAVAIALECKGADGKIDMAKAALLIRASGICFKSGYSVASPTDTLTQSEWSGHPYANWAATNPQGIVYPEKHSDKVAICAPFAKKLVAVTTVPVAEPVKA